MKKHKIFVLGATGPTGVLFCQKALKAGHELTIYARSPAKLPDHVSSHANVKIIKGDLTDHALLLSSLLPTHTLLLSLLGPNSLRTPSGIFVSTYRALIPHLIQHGPKRCLILGTISIPGPNDSHALAATLSITAVRLLAPSAYHEIVGVGKLFDDEAAQLQWTMFRVGGLANGDGDVVATTIGGQGYSPAVRRGGVAAWLVEQCGKEEPEYLREKPLLCSTDAGLFSWRVGNIFK